MPDAHPFMDRATLEPHLVRLIAGLRAHDVELAVHMLLNYIDEGRPPVAPVIGDAEAFALFRTFVVANAKALRMVAHWGDGHCGALHEVLLAELQNASSIYQPSVGRALAVGEQQGALKHDPNTAPLFAEDGGVDP